MKHLPKISVVMPSFNQGEFIEQALLSIFEQHYENTQLIVIDGGSTDQSVDIIRKYEDRLFFWSAEPDEGQSDAINKGMNRATGLLVAWLNSDDFYVPGAFSLIADVYTKHPHASFYFGDGLRVDREGRKVSNFFPNGPHFDYVSLFYGLDTILQPASFINGAFWRRLGGLDKHLKYGMDWDLWLRLAALARPQAVDAVLAASREYGETKTAHGGLERFEELRRIGEKYTGEPLTPGAFCYLLDTLQQHISSQRQCAWYSPAVAPAIDQLWAQVNRTLVALAGRPDGFPVPDMCELCQTDQTGGVRLDSIPVPAARESRAGNELGEFIRSLRGLAVDRLTEKALAARDTGVGATEPGPTTQPGATHAEAARLEESARSPATPIPDSTDPQAPAPPIEELRAQLAALQNSWWVRLGTHLGTLERTLVRHALRRDMTE